MSEFESHHESLGYLPRYRDLASAYSGFETDIDLDLGKFQWRIVFVLFGVFFAGVCSGAWLMFEVRSW